MQQTAIKYGIIAGIGTVLYMLVFYYMNRAFAINPFVSLSTLLIAVIGMVKACSAQRSINGGVLTRKEALKTSFSVAVLSGLFFYAFLYILFKFIDPGLNQLLQDKTIAAGPAAANRHYEMTIGTIMSGYAFSLLYGFLLALMVANFLKR